MLRLLPFNISGWSLLRRQLVVLGGSLTVLAILLAIGGAWFINDVAERTSDRMLAASLRAISETVALEGGAITLDIPVGAFGMLEDNARDDVFYSVRHGDRFLTGYEDFPAMAQLPGRPDELVFRYERYHGERVRVVAADKFLPRLREPVTIQVAESLGERHSLARRMMIGLVLLEFALVGFAVFLLRPAIRWGLRPVMTIESELRERGGSSPSLRPLHLEQVPAELKSLVQDFNGVLHRLERTFGRMERFTANASHQMRTPLAALRTHVEMLRGEIGGGPADRLVGQIEAGTERLQRLVTQLLSLARAEAKDGADPVNTEASAICRLICASLAPAIVARGKTIEYDGEESFAIVDPLLLEELMFNLVDNALRYSGAGQLIRVTVADAAPGVRITVEDDGPGIPLEEIERVRERFARLHRDQSKPGSGLGLSIAETICEAAGYRLHLGKSGLGGLRVDVEPAQIAENRGSI